MQTLLHLHPMTDGRSVILTFREIALTNPTLFRKHLRLSFLPHSTPLTYRKATRRRLCQLSIALPGSIGTNPLRHQLETMSRELKVIEIGITRTRFTMRVLSATMSGTAPHSQSGTSMIAVEF